MDKTRVRVLIDGMEFNIVGEKDSRYISYLAKDIDRRIEELFDRNPRLSRLEAALLVAINLKDELEEAKGELTDIKKKVDVEAFKEFMTKEEALERILELEAKLKENNIQVAKYKDAESFSSEQLKKESRRFKDSYEKVQRLEAEIERKEEELQEVIDRLKEEEQSNIDNEEELKALRRELNNLKQQTN